ncbi:ABC-2 type transporter [Corynebacterium guangdongense]|uniref:ABC-2 type transport system permease protein n=1 Tax=Corynebacterium guangdongense TaxID=1783348 RepID=A0ABU1ZWV0_9CORY|nr:ABC-2 type transport system permease protein [Corynebacterium guangdongense]WJZ17950.1 ABC-2 type transporter [Corynebacterium guangdongense]
MTERTIRREPAETLAAAFPPGTFTPAPKHASHAAMARAQGLIETKLMIRHGEQQLLNLIVPLAMLIVAAFIPVLGEETGVAEVFPMILAVAATSAGFTGQAIGLAFDRRYGALKRTGASGVPAWTIIVGKILAVLAMVVIQILLLGVTALILGWRADAVGVVFGLITLLVGVTAFTSMGLLMGGSMSAEAVLGLANLVWLILVALVGWVLYSQGLADAGWWNLLPSVALASGLTVAFGGAVPWLQLGVLTVWAALASAAAVKWFRFD